MRFGEEWSVRTSPSGGVFTGVAYLGGDANRWILTGDAGGDGVIWTAEKGVLDTWTPRATLDPGAAASAAATVDGDLAAVVGYDGTEGVSQRSVDGLIWEADDTGLEGEELMFVMYGEHGGGAPEGPGFFALGSAKVWHRDASETEFTEQGAPGDLFSLAWDGNPGDGTAEGGGVFVGVGESGGVGIGNRSDDGGDSWSGGTFEIAPVGLRGIAFGNGRWVAVGQGNAYVSLDGVVDGSSDPWVEAEVPTNPWSGDLLGIVFAAGWFYTFGEGGRLARSQDGLEWELLTVDTQQDLFAGAWDGASTLLIVGDDVVIATVGLEIQAVLPGEVGEEGGYLVRLFADFTSFLAEDFVVRIGPDELEGLSGVPGEPRTMRPLSRAELRFYTPRLAPGTYDLVVESESAFGSISGALRVYPRDYRSKDYALRRQTLPIVYSGAQRPEIEPPATGNMPAAVGWHEAVLSAIGEEDNDLGGYRITRLREAADAEAQLADLFEWDGTAAVKTWGPSLIPDPGFEADGSGWTLSGWTVLSSGQRSGAKVAGLDVGVAVGLSVMVLADKPAVEGQLFRARAWLARTNDGAAGARVAIAWYTAGLAFISQSNATTAVLTEAYQLNEVVAAAPATAAFARMIVQRAGAQVATTIFADDTALYTPPGDVGVEVGDWIRLSDGGRPFQVASVNDWDVGITVPTGSTPPTGPTVQGLAATLTWNGTTTVAASSVAELAAGLWVRLDLDGQWFEVDEVFASTFRIKNPLGLTIPTGSTFSSWSPDPVTFLGNTSLQVETTLDWPSSGRVVIEGTIYAYGSKTADPPSLDEVSHGGIAGLAQDHPEMALVADQSRSRSAMERLRRALLVPYAEGKDLNALGRNLGVPRFPFLADEDIYRAVVQSLAYSPRGTQLAFEMLLDALAGPGNYVLREDAVSNPCRVYVSITGGAFFTGDSLGKAFLRDLERQLATDADNIDIDYPVADRGVVHGVRFADEDQEDDFRDQLPSDIVKTEYTGDAGVPAWAYFGADEGTEVTQLAGEGVKVGPDGSNDETAGYHSPEARITPDSYVCLQVLQKVPEPGDLDNSGTMVNQWGAFINDGEAHIGWGSDGVTINDYTIGLRGGADPSAGDAYIDGAAATLLEDVYYDIELRKYGRSHVDLLVDGKLVQRLPYSAFTEAPGAFAASVAFGQWNLTQNDAYGVVRRVGWHSRTHTDYWSARGIAAETVDTGPQDIVIDDTILVSPDDEGKVFHVRGSGATPNAFGGNGNGTYEVESVSANDTAVLRGRLQTAGITLRADAVANRVRVAASGQKFRYPDDLGKKLVITGSDLGNDDEYTIGALLDEHTLVDLSEMAGRQLPETAETTVALLDGATLVAESTGVDWRLNPAFESETDLEWELCAAGAESGQTLTLRQDLPADRRRVMVVRYSDVLSAQVLLDTTVDNVMTQEDPSVEFSHYPFYLSDPLGFVRFYLDEVRAAMYLVELLKE